MNPDIYSIGQVAEIVAGQLQKGRNYSECQIKHLLTDSRKIINAESSLFFAIKGNRRDGHAFIPDLYQAGVRHFVVTSIPNESEYDDAAFLVVKDPLGSMQALASRHRQKFSLPVVGITGSNGKTIVKEWLFQLLKDRMNIVRSPKSYNSQIGVPLSVWQIHRNNDLGVFEAGISKPGEMKNLERVIRPTTGIFTNIGEAHAENFDSLQQKVDEKLKLFSNCDTLIYCKDYDVIHNSICNSRLSAGKPELFTWSKRSRADLQIGRISRSSTGTTIQGIHNNEFKDIHIAFTDDASIENSINCWAYLLSEGIDDGYISEHMGLLSPVAMRLEMKEGVNNCSVINDSYNSDLGSLTIALDFMNQQKQHANKVLILSDILQSGKRDASLYNEVASLIREKGVNKLIGIGEHISEQSELFDLEKRFYSTTDAFLRDYNPNMFHNETILVKGARVFGFERISRVLQQKAHETVLEINLNALVHNLNFYRSRLHPETKVMAMVKALSYGSGSFEIANILEFHRVDYLAVAYADEGVELRKAGVSLPIMVMSPEEPSFDTMVEFKLEPEIYSFRTLQLFNDAVLRRQKDEGNERMSIHLKLDTGMHRLGFVESEINELVVRIKNFRHLKVTSIFSHLAASDEPAHDEFTRQQVESFERMSDNICKHFSRKILRHILNSSGVIRFPEYQFDMIRLGIGLHGIAATPNEQKQLEFVSTLKSSVSQIKTVRSGSTIGYSRKGVASKDIRVATIAIGYADGLDRRLGNGVGKLYIKGRGCPTIGNICMDMCMVDVTDVEAKAGDEVIVFGKEPRVIDVADSLGTIPYEVLTSVSHRVKRVYYQE
jgi:alanine racemase